MIRIEETDVFKKWIRVLADLTGRGIILQRLKALGRGNFGDQKDVGDGVYELRVHVGPSYRVYYAKRGDTIVILLCGGDKRTQTRDIKRAKAMTKEV